MKKKIIITILFLFILLGCNLQSQEVLEKRSEPVKSDGVDETLSFDPYYCEKDEDCALTRYDFNSCCMAFCAIFTLNHKGIIQQKTWRETHCFEEEKKFTDKKWADCFESGECGLWSSGGKIIQGCIKNRCVIKSS